ncbi:MAG: hypothetical protein QM774_11145 [Gordonia sp. (in: high G+C Gram-positive bacteria)]|uniref:hypothetical protein n=1 Tax=Gordonia sp. (in: high G+C Gram-positive bacteria) TaxID=84139 RepID=UPI0039E5F0D9
MTFVAARVVDPASGRVVLGADTKATYYDDTTKTLRDLSEPLQKVVILSDDVVAGVAGDDPERTVQRLYELRNRSLDDVLNEMVRFTAYRKASRSVLIAKRGPDPVIVTIVNGALDDRTTTGLGMIGDPRATREFNRLFKQDLTGMPGEERRFVGSLLSLITLGIVDSVGGFIAAVAGDSAYTFRFQAHQGGVGPWRTNAALLPDRRTLRITVPPGGDPTSHKRIILPGQWPTYRAVAFLIPEAGIAWLHTHDEPWSGAIRIPGSQPEEVLEIARRSHNQVLRA